MNRATGRCVRCGATGASGEPCVRPACAARGRHFIPEEDARPFMGDQAPPALVGSRVRDWLVLGHVGEGGIGDVYRVIRLPHGRPEAALKLLRVVDGEHADRLLAKFIGEAEALGRINDPNVVALLDHGEFEGRPYLVMRYIKNAEDLATRIERGPMSLDDVVDVLTQIATGLAAAHGRQVVHRDIKPSNIMLQRRAMGGVHVTIIDFGLAKDVAVSDLTSVAVGTPRYMAPELVLPDRPIGPWTDWYALTVLAFELLIGGRLFEAFTSEEMLLVKRHQDLDPTEHALGDRRLDPVVYRFFALGLAFDPEARYGSADDFLHGLGLAVEALRRAAQPAKPAARPPVATADALEGDFGPSAVWGRVGDLHEALSMLEEPDEHDATWPDKELGDLRHRPEAPPSRVPEETDFFDTRDAPPRPARGRTARLVAIMVAGVAIGGGLAWWLGQQREAPEPAQIEAPPAVEEAPRE